jgi:transcriptional regulator with XRE-family HTH domain
VTTGGQLVREELRPFAEELLRLLDVRGMSQAHFADLINVSPSAVSNWTTGRQRPTVANIEAAEDILSVARGHLGRLLGYLSGSESPRAETLREFLERDGQLTPSQQVILTGVYDEFLRAGARQPTRKPRRNGQ